MSGEAILATSITSYVFWGARKYNITLFPMVSPPNIVLVIERLVMAAYVGETREVIVCLN